MLDDLSWKAKAAVRPGQHRHGSEAAISDTGREPDNAAVKHPTLQKQHGQTAVDLAEGEDEDDEPRFHHGDWVSFRHGKVEHIGSIVASGMDGVTLQDADGREHQVRHGGTAERVEKLLSQAEAADLRKAIDARKAAPFYQRRPIEPEPPSVLGLNDVEHAKTLGQLMTPANIAASAAENWGPDWRDGPAWRGAFTDRLHTLGAELRAYAAAGDPKPPPAPIREPAEDPTEDPFAPPEPDDEPYPDREPLGRG